MTHTLRLSVAMEVAASESLPLKPKAQPSWFHIEEDKLSKLVEERNIAMSSYFKHRTRSYTAQLRTARKKLKTAVSAAKNKWIQEKCKMMNDGGMERGTGQFWKALGKIKKGLSKTSPAAEKMMTKADGTK